MSSTLAIVLSVAIAAGAWWTGRRLIELWRERARWPHVRTGLRRTLMAGILFEAGLILVLLQAA